MGRSASKFVRPLSQADREFLQEVWREHSTFTVRCRAHAVLLSAEGYTVKDLQKVFDIRKATALAWIDRWEERGRDGLEDDPRPGGPPILNQEEQEVLLEELQRYPRQPKRIIAAVKQRTGKTISRTTLRRWARRLGFRWKRMRKSLWKRRDQREFRLAQQDIEELRLLPGVDVAFFDEAAFSLSGVVPYGWQPIGIRGDVHVGARGTIQVLGITVDGGDTYGYLHRGKVSGQTVEEVLEDFSRRIQRPTMLILDNASVHTCSLVANHIAAWNERNLYFYFLPTYSPELNDIERLWEKLKYQILPLDAWQSFADLRDGLFDVFDRIGAAIALPSIAH